MTITKKNSKIKKNSKTKKNSLRKKLNISGGASPIYVNIQKSICTLLKEYEKYENHTYGNIEPQYNTPAVGEPVYKRSEIIDLVNENEKKLYNEIIKTIKDDIPMLINKIKPKLTEERKIILIDHITDKMEKKNNVKFNIIQVIDNVLKYVLTNENIYSVANNLFYELPIPVPDKIQTKINNWVPEVADKFYELINIIADRTLLNMVYELIENITNKKYNIANLSNEQIKKYIADYHKQELYETEDKIFNNNNETHNELILTYVKKYIEYIIKYIEENPLTKNQIFIPKVKISKPPQLPPPRKSAPASASKQASVPASALAQAQVSAPSSASAPGKK
jgi:hypothetical protein